MQENFFRLVCCVPVCLFYYLMCAFVTLLIKSNLLTMYLPTVKKLPHSKMKICKDASPTLYVH